ncbi:hypothetical protein PV08_07168 [Exophiala spinifera]|uniref:ABC transporter n=1 Tax=Exophiala spinifera TaxID=91928 RepID=A0A0D1YHI3_9EURO|nr:uncharacterized protein PV08_07168 [Exophiala spinifera]KIW14386.1 hypothetical protein PV08_07168 [Exophiala spinifera]
MAGCPSDSDQFFGPRVPSSCRSLDFTLFFEDVFLGCLPAALFIFLSPSSVFMLVRRPPLKPSCRSPSFIAQSAALLANTTALLVMLVLRIQISAFRTRASLAADILSLVATGIVQVFLFWDHRRSLRPSTAPSLYLTASILSGVVRTRTLWLISPPVPVPVASTVALGSSSVALLLQSRKKHIPPSTDNQPFAPEQLSGIWSRTIFAWIVPLLRTGHSKIISLHDLPSLDQKLRSIRLADELSSTWARYDQKRRYSLFYACIHAYVFSFLSPIVPRLCLAAFTFSQPFLIATTVKFVDQQNLDSHSGKGIIAGWALVYLGIAVCKSIYWYQNVRFTTRLRGGLSALVYRQSLHMRSFESGEHTAMALMSTDVERLANGMLSFHEVWTSLVSIAVASWLLGLQLSIACLMPVLLVTAFVAITSKVSILTKDAQVAWIKQVQERLRVTGATLNVVKTVKMAGLDGVVSEAIQRLRVREIQSSAVYRKLLTVTVFLSLAPMNLAPVLTFSMYTVIAVFWKNETLLTVQAFTSVSLIALLTSPVVIFIQSLPNFVQCLGLFERIQEFCSGDLGVHDGNRCSQVADYVGVSEKSVDVGPEPDQGRKSIELSRVSFCWSKDRPPVLKSLDATIHRGNITVIAGPVGAGKSALLKSLLGELIPVSASPESTSKQYEILSEGAAYCAQQPWLENGTIFQNIIGQSVYDQRWYSSVKAACALDVDIESLQHADQTRIGSEGVSLSGGQKQRVALARAVYSRRKTILLDDVFSSMDMRTANIVSNRLFGKHGLLRKPHITVIIATYTGNIMAFADAIVILEDGRITEVGTPSSLLGKSSYVHKLGRKSVQDSETVEEVPPSELLPPDEFSHRLQEASEEAVDTEHDLRRKNGDLSVYQYYFQSAGAGVVALYLTFVTLLEFCTNFSVVLLKWWSEANEKQPNHDVGLWMGLYAMLAMLGTLGIFVSAWVAFVFVISNTAIRFHTDLLETTFRSSFRVLAATDHGQLLNRFSHDMELIDMELPIVLVNYTSTAVSCFISLIILAIFSKYLGVSLPLLAVLVYFLQRFYLQTSRQMRLLSIEARAPLYTHFTESVAGAVTIRAFGWQSQYEKKCCHHIDVAQAPAYLQSCIQHWLNFVLDVLVTVLAVVLVATVVTWHDKFSSGSVGVGLIMVTGFNEILARLIQNLTKAESSVGAVARVMRFVRETEPEDPRDQLGSTPPDWPSNGAVEFVSIVASYQGVSRNAEQAVLRNISLEIRPGQHIAICGRTGSGKTSLASCLVQMMVVHEGHIIVDGVDVSKLSPQDLRSRLNVVPQDLLLLPGSLRTNIDPFQVASDDTIVASLMRVGLWDMVREQGGLDVAIDVAAWSMGQRQLLCLCRAMVRQSKVLILDEITSSVDSETESKIQDIIDNEFRACTVLAVMHRLDHILRYDMVALLEDGRLLEYDQPGVLLAQESKFAQLYQKV